MTEVDRSASCAVKLPLDLTLNPFTEFPERQFPVPNHLLESQNFNRLGKNQIVQVTPAVVNFAGFTPGKTYRKVVRLCNASSDVQVVHIIPPESTEFFAIKYNKHGRFLPGTITEIAIKFTPDSHRYYFDAIRIHCKGGDNLIVPINAYSVADVSKFPAKVNFTSPSNRLGRVVTKKLSLASKCPISFEFEIAILQSHPAFMVTPLTGTIPGNGETIIQIDYYPTEYSTAHMKMQLMTSQFSADPIVCEVTGVCSPKKAEVSPLAKSIKTLDEVFQSQSVFDPRALDPLQIARSRQTSKAAASSSKGGSGKASVVQRGGYVVPADIMTAHGVHSVLTQKKGKLRLKDLREMPADQEGGGDDTERNSNSRQIKQAEFERLIQQDVIKERANQLKWQVHLGANAMTAKQMKAVRKSRAHELEVYETQVKQTPKEEVELERLTNKRRVGKTRRWAGEEANHEPTFDLYKNSPWSQRHKALFRFKQAAGTIIVRQRANRKIILLRKLIKTFRSFQASLMTFKSADSIHNKTTAPPVFQIKVHNPTKKDKAQNSFQTNFIHANIKCGLPMQFTDAFSSDPGEDTTALVSSESNSTNDKPVVEPKYQPKQLQPFFDLCVPKYYENAAYRRQNLEECFRNYIPPKLARKLRSGAEDELILVPEQRRDSTCSQAPLDDVDIAQTDDCTTANITPPAALMRNPPSHPWHIFNRAPGTILHHLPLPLSAVDPECYVCPEPKCRMDPGSDKRPYLDHDDVIKGMMSWKRFNSYGLKALSSLPSLSDVWLPRRRAPFSTASLPDRLPALLTALPAEDRECCGSTDDEESGCDVAPRLVVTPAMVCASFACEEQIRREMEEEEAEVSSEVPISGKVIVKIPDAVPVFPCSGSLPASNIAVGACGPITRDQRLRDLEQFLHLQKENVAMEQQQEDKD